MKKFLRLQAVILLLFLSFYGYNQNLGEPVYNYTSKTILNDSVIVYDYIGYGLNKPDKEQYVEVNGLCEEVSITYYGDYVDRYRELLNEKGYSEAGYNLFYGPYGFVKAKIEFNAYTTISFKLLNSKRQ